MTGRPLVPVDFAVPARHGCAGYLLVPLGPEHNASDHRAWTSSVDHIRSLPEFPDGSWPDPAMTLADNLRDLQRHRRDVDDRRGFTYTVLDRDDEVAGCVYLYPDRTAGTEAEVSSWLRADHATREAEFRAAVTSWIIDAWPFDTWTSGGQARSRPPTH
ncbi:N-acetyltransferase [Pseudonocardia humida]|uniref:N-acetyltransferase n=1 Tax=Pseudonocardia humida TaxID=2800819 RepID=A0ABT1A5V9_9PSEU|nr:N-acetyltransferase [Pseudonocardia humida]MCO1658129.1 N-acetyltransferase [Pseudonocardia humida]